MLELFALFVAVLVAGWTVNLWRYERALKRRDWAAALRHKERGFF